MQLQLLLADGTSFFALAAHREVQLSFLQKYGFVERVCAAFAATLTRVTDITLASWHFSLHPNGSNTNSDRSFKPLVHIGSPARKCSCWAFNS
jgi:hypothetical protein